MNVRFLVVSLALVACGGVEPESLFEPGEADVGYRTVEISYAAPGQDEPRTIPVEIWYPADASGSELATYEVSGIVDVESEAAYAGADVAIEGSAPLMVYSHGSGGQGLLGYAYGEHLASHGWVVVAPDHVGNTALDYARGAGAPFVRITADRPGDLGAVLDAAEAGELAGLDVDAASALVVGHSFGGYTALAMAGMRLDVQPFLDACDPVPEEDDDGSCDAIANEEVRAALDAGFRDDRVAAIVPQAPALVSAALPDTLPAIDVPVLVQSGLRDQSTTHEQQAVPLWDGLDGASDVWVQLPDGGHYSFVTICDDLDPGLLALFISNADEDGCDDTFIPVSEAVPALAATLQAFGNAHVLGEKGWEEALVEAEWSSGFEVEARGE